MSFYDLQNLFWQLDASERFSGTETRLYFYWLNRLNAGLGGEYWPDEYPRWGKQVEADLGLTDKTLAAARAALVKRGLLAYKEGTKSRAATWGLGKIVRNISGQSEEIAPNMARKDSGQSGNITPNMSRNNSGLYKEKKKTSSNRKDKDPAASAPVEGSEDLGALASPAESSADAPHTEGAATSVATRKGDGQKGQKGQKPAKSDKTEPAHFAAFWEAYPRHDDQAGAIKSFARLPEADQIAAADRARRWIARRTDWIAADGTDYRPYAATWLNKARWKELAEPQPTPSPAIASTHATHSATPRPGTARHHVPVVTSYGKL